MAVFVTSAGDGGTNPGAINPRFPHLPEKVLNLDIERRVATLLKNIGHTVHRARTTDVRQNRPASVDLAIRVKADVLIEIHCNAFVTPFPRGVEVYYTANRLTSRLIAKTLAAKISYYSNIPPRPTPYRPWLVPRHHHIEAEARRAEQNGVRFVLAENGFMSNPADMIILATSHGRQNIAKGYQAAMQQLFQVPDKPNGLTPPSAVMWPWLVIGGVFVTTLSAIAVKKIL